MTKDEAISLIEKGEKITHKLFRPTEWLTMKNNEIVFENGIEFSSKEFQKFRTADHWDTGYSIYKETKP